MISALSKSLVKIQSSYWLNSGLYSSLSKGSTVLIGFVNFFILIRMLSWSDYGAWVLFISVCTIMEHVKHGFIRNPLVRFLSTSSVDEQAALQTASLVLNFVAGLFQIAGLVAAAYFLSQFWQVPQLKSLFIIYIVTSIALVPANHFEIVQQAGMKFRDLFLCSLIRHAGLLFFVVVSFLLGWNITLNQLAIAQGVSAILSCLFAVAMNSNLFVLATHVERRWLTTLFDYGKFTFGTNVSSMIMKNIDMWILGRMMSVEAVALFNPAVRMSNLVEVPADTLSFIYFPKLSRDAARGNSEVIKTYYEKAVAAVLAIMIPVVVVVVLLAEPIIYFIAGPGFDETPSILRITMLFGLLIPFNRFFGVTMDAIGLAKTNFHLVMLMAGLNIISNIICIRYFGVIGAAYGTLTTYLVMVAGNQLYLHRKFGISILSVLREVLQFYRRFIDFGLKTLFKS